MATVVDQAIDGDGDGPERAGGSELLFPSC
jgi:hypothetical protein